MPHCLCGSGKDRQSCHGEISPHILRTQLKHRVSHTQDKFSFQLWFEPKSMPKTEVQGEVILIKSMTPAGVIFYPLLVKYNNKAIRPLTIDGLAFNETATDVEQAIICMLTPISQCTIGFNISDLHEIHNNYYKADCHLFLRGNPFDSVFALETQGDNIALYHHTSENNMSLILSSGILKGSKWSIKGTNELKDINYIYLTDLDAISNAFDLVDIAMQDSGTTLSVVTDDDKTSTLTVYRDDHTNRHHSIKLWVNPTMIAFNPLILHGIDSNSRQNQYGGFSWWEVFVPSIYRIPVSPDGYLPLKTDPTSGEIYLEANEHYKPQQGFRASYGYDLLSLLRMWSEMSNEEMPRQGNIPPADFGLPDPEWIKTWENSLAKLIADNWFE